MRLFIGVDPGKGGGIAILDEAGHLLKAERMPETDGDLLTLLRALPGDPAKLAALERVHASPQMGVSSAFTFGCGYGAVRMALLACGIPIFNVTPQAWQKFMNCRTHGDKNVSKRAAQEAFPAETVTHALADALLIAEWLRRVTVAGSVPPERNHAVVRAQRKAKRKARVWPEKRESPF